MSKRLTKLLVPVVLALPLASCAEEEPAAAPPGDMATSAPGAMSTTAAPDAGQSTEIRAGDDFFAPEQLTVAVGSTVTVNNKGQDDHNWVSGQLGVNSGNLKPDQTFGYTFERAGTYDFRCTYHPGMDMKVTVEG